MAKESAKQFRKMTDTELANYYVDVCAYKEQKAIEEQRVIRTEMVYRFIGRFADNPMESD